MGRRDSIPSRSSSTRARGVAEGLIAVEAQRTRSRVGCRVDLETMKRDGEVAPTEPLTDSREQRVERALDYRLTLVVHYLDGAELARLLPGVPVVVGRGSPSTLRIPDATLSREHARFTAAGSHVLVEDLGSTNGIRVAGERVREARLEAGDEVMLGGARAFLHVLGASGEELGIEGEERFRRSLDQEAARAQQFRRPFALLTARTTAAGATTEDRANDAPGAVEICGWVRSQLRPVDRMALYGPDAFQILLPETGADAAAAMARILAARAGAGNRLLVGVAVYPEGAATVEALIGLSRAMATSASTASPIAIVPSATWSDSDAAPGDALLAGAAMRGVLETVTRVAASRIPVILHGETGTGKEVLAHRIHHGGPRGAKRMVRVNCGAIPEQLVESTLFGHERGAFTGAMQQQKGVFEEADGGTVFLDEIGELPLSAQAALLRVLETGSFARVGATREMAVDVRIIAATHRDLEAMVAEKTFREDLYYRLNTMTITIPPLRARRDEIEPLARRFLRQANEANGRDVQGIAPEALARLQVYAWPGNVRELKNAIERAVVVARAALLGAEDLPARLLAAGPMAVSALPVMAVTMEKPVPVVEDEDGAEKLRTRVQQYEAQMIRAALEASGWSRPAAAERLGMPLRTLRHKIKVLGINKVGV